MHFKAAHYHLHSHIPSFNPWPPFNFPSNQPPADLLYTKHNYKKTTLLKPSLSIQKKDALKKFVNRGYLIISKVDKGGATALQDIDRCIKKQRK